MTMMLSRIAMEGQNKLQSRYDVGGLCGLASISVGIRSVIERDKHS